MIEMMLAVMERALSVVSHVQVHGAGDAILVGGMGVRMATRLQVRATN